VNIAETHGARQKRGARVVYDDHGIMKNAARCKMNETMAGGFLRSSFIVPHFPLMAQSVR
jgi:hypothetical protein